MFKKPTATTIGGNSKQLEIFCFPDEDPFDKFIIEPKLTNKQYLPITKKITEPIKLIKYGAYHFVCLTAINNNIYVYGYGSFGGVGKVNGKRERAVFEKLNENFGEVKFLECGIMSTVLINNENEVFCTGNLRNFSSVNFVKIVNDCVLSKEMENVKLLRLFYNYIFFVTEYEIFVIELQKNAHCIVKYKQTIIHKIKDLQCNKEHTITLDETGTVYFLNHFTKKLEKVNLNCTVKQISCYASGCLILNNFGEIYGKGNNYFGQLGFDNKKREIFNFKKLNIPNDEIVKSIFTSFDYNNIIITKKENKIYTSGKTSANMLKDKNIYLKKRNEHENEFLIDIETVFVDKFSEIKLNNEMLFINFILQSTIYFVTSNYPLLNNENDIDYLQLNCFKKIQTKKLLDISIYLTD